MDQTKVAADSCRYSRRNFLVFNFGIEYCLTTSPPQSFLIVDPGLMDAKKSFSPSKKIDLSGSAMPASPLWGSKISLVGGVAGLFPIRALSFPIIYQGR